MAISDNPIGTFLRARREQVTPAQAAISAHGRRRVPGLRREEVATLAGISADYYLRLEQGRHRTPSPQVLEALARVLRLDDDHFAYLLALATPSPRRRAAVDQAPPPGAMKLLARMTQPAFIENRYFDVLASNARARALDPRLAVGNNHLRDAFVEASAQDLYPDWQSATECLVANLRRAVGRDTDDARFRRLTRDLSAASPRFQALWERNEVREQAGGATRYRHPLVGTMTLDRERMSIDGTDGLMMVVFHAEPGSVDAGKLARLSSVAPPVASGG